MGVYKKRCVEPLPDVWASVQEMNVTELRGKMGICVLHVVGQLTFGGMEQLCLEVVRHRPPNVKAIVLCLNSAEAEMEHLFRGIEGVEIRFGQTEGRIRSILGIARVLREVKADGVIVYAFNVQHLLVRLAALLCGREPVMCSAGNPPPTRRNRWKWRVVVLGSRLLRTPIQAQSETIMRGLRGLGMGLPTRSGVIADGCDVAGISARAHAAALKRPRDGTVVVGMVARFNAIKDQETLVKAFAELLVRADMPRVVLWLVGDGDTRKRVGCLVDRLGCADHVVFWGARADVPELLGQMDIYAFSTTRDEGFGIAVIEAMAAGLPVMASDVSACREVLGRGSAGQLVEPRAVGKWADVLEQWIRHPNERKVWADRGKKRVEETYDIRVCAGEWYRRVLAGQRV